MSDEPMERAYREWLAGRPKERGTPLNPPRRCYACDSAATGFYDPSIVGPAAGVSNPMPACDRHRVVFSGALIGSQESFNAGWNAVAGEAEARIAALEAALREIANASTGNSIVALRLRARVAIGLAPPDTTVTIKPMLSGLIHEADAALSRSEEAL